jgi:hypothetical protein
MYLITNKPYDYCYLDPEIKKIYHIKLVILERADQRQYEIITNGIQTNR